MVRCGREPGFTAETVKLLEGHFQAGREWGLKAVCWGWGCGALERWVQRGSRNSEGEPVPCHIPLKSKCRGTSPGRGGSVAQRLGRQAVTALGHGPARLAQLHPTPAHPHLAQAGARVRQATPSGQSRALHEKSPITQPQHPLGETPCREAPQLPSAWATTRVCCL